MLNSVWLAAKFICTRYLLAMFSSVNQSISGFRHEEVTPSQVSKSKICASSSTYKTLQLESLCSPVKTPNQSLKHLNVLLDWTSTDSLSYKFYLLSSTMKGDILNEGIRWTQKLQETGLLVIVLEVPNFTNQLVYAFTGLLSFGTHDQKISFTLPPFSVSCEEILSRTATDEDPQNLVVSIAASNEKFEFVLLLPSNWNRSLDTVFETYCCLKRIDVNLKTGGYYVAQNVCPAFDQALVEVRPKNEEKAASVVDVNVYAKDFASVSSLIHYLHQRIVNVRIIPRHFYKHSAFVHPEVTQCDPKKIVKSAVMEELKATQRFLEERDNSSNLDALMNCKYQTNMAFLRCQEHKKQKEESP